MTLEPVLRTTGLSILRPFTKQMAPSWNFDRSLFSSNERPQLDAYLLKHIPSVREAPW
jgi:hypothetical protein